MEGGSAREGFETGGNDHTPTRRRARMKEVKANDALFLILARALCEERCNGLVRITWVWVRCKARAPEMRHAKGPGKRHYESRKKGKELREIG